MPEHQLSFAPNMDSSSDELAGGSPVAHNVVVDKHGAVCRRPGIRLSSHLVQFVLGGVWNAPVSGLHATLDGEVLAVKSEVPRHVVRVNRASYLEMGAVPGSVRPAFAETESIVAISGGASMQKYVKADSAVTELLATEATAPPQRVTSVIANNIRLLCNSLDIDSTKVFYSSVQTGSGYAGHEDWVTGSSGSFQAESRPDPVVALGENTNEVFVWGSETLQIYQPDETRDYAPLPTQEVGLSAARSVVKVDRAFAWLDQFRRFVLSDGRSVTILSTPIQKALHALTRVDDCFGYRLVLGNNDVLVWTFPSDGRTFVWAVEGGWSQWSSWHAEHQRFAPFPVSSHAYDHTRGVNFVGLNSGFVAQFQEGHPSDFQDGIRAMARTGFLSFGTNRRKQCTIYLVLKRGRAAQSYEERVGTFSWRDELGPWESRPIELGELGEDQAVLRFRSTGVFRRRQFEIEFTGQAEFVLADATVDVLELGS